jgi:preprotein translocase subunit SecG
LVILVAIVVGLLVWHATRANQARLGIRSRRGQIRGMGAEIRKFLVRGVVVLAVLVLLLYIYLRVYLHL